MARRSEEEKNIGIQLLYIKIYNNLERTQGMLNVAKWQWDNGTARILTDFCTSEAIRFGIALKISYLCIVNWKSRGGGH